jgi:hypothetical protein
MNVNYELNTSGRKVVRNLFAEEIKSFVIEEIGVEFANVDKVGAIVAQR